MIDRDKTALITVFTPTYNRRDIIGGCYESLKNQTSKNFEWLVIDDGSSDNTGELIKQWQDSDPGFCIRYFFKENGGLFSAYNTAVEKARTELFMCIDSDDRMPENGIERIETIWSEIRDRGYVGIMGLDETPEGQVVGGRFPEGVHEMYLYEKLVRYAIPGDKKMVHRTDLLKKEAPVEQFPGEKYFNPSYLMYLLDKYGKLYVTNDRLCIADYQPDGMSSNMYRQYKNSPRGYARTRLLYMSFPGSSTAFKYRQCIHYVSSCLLSGDFLREVRKSPFPLLTLLAVIPGTMLTMLIEIKQ